ncbi:hypothetical protein M6B22_11240 [Jatrophihabitans cynanchi]|uniref:Restriction endonuclease type IV Mrr domain-containing protein n=1 Tax=Jatrophihabitans cynanchi TaxID=2944128 RepID=A0ABY7JRF0_9ACTN|nr:hypothetical protein [Jatrophihabitans sp. SB3-54]WAX55135.1 hypothetical protein M6B22_11240 [Jatrophihabitans sp. SB3-54]
MDSLTEHVTPKRLATISKRDRRLLASAGLTSWAAGGVATFVSGNGSGAVALVAAGLAAGVLAGVGRWPTRVVVSGSEMYWEEVDAELKDAQEDASPEMVAELEQLRARLAALRETRGEPTSTPEDYDRQLLLAISRLRPDVRVTSAELLSPFAADFRAEADAGVIWIETKWRRTEAAPFRGRTLSSLLGGLQPSDRLLVVANAIDVEQASQLITQALGARGRVVGWRNATDDDDLLIALNDLLPLRT